MPCRRLAGWTAYGGPRSSQLTGPWRRSSVCMLRSACCSLPLLLLPLPSAEIVPTPRPPTPTLRQVHSLHSLLTPFLFVPEIYAPYLCSRSLISTHQLNIFSLAHTLHTNSILSPSRSPTPPPSTKTSLVSPSLHGCNRQELEHLAISDLSISAATTCGAVAGPLRCCYAQC
jgi:hypothetical protein